MRGQAAGARSASLATGRGKLFLLLAALTLPGCAETGFLAQLFKRGSGSTDRSTASGPYVIGTPYKVGATWHYPREQFDYDETGIASIDRGGRRTTVTGERFDPDRLTAAHNTLQLPAVARVTNLENGRQVVLRINERGPRANGRILDVTPRTAQLLGFDRAGTARVRVQVLEQESRMIAGELGATTGPQPVVAAAPRGAVQADTLAPPTGARQAANVRSAPAAPRPTAPVRTASATAAGAPLPETVTQVAPRPGALYIQAGAFTRADNAERLRARLSAYGARVMPGTLDGKPIWKVRVGPIADVRTADATLDRMLKSGLAEGRIVVD